MNNVEKLKGYIQLHKKSLEKKDWFKYRDELPEVLMASEYRYTPFTYSSPKKLIKEYINLSELNPEKVYNSINPRVYKKTFTYLAQEIYLFDNLIYEEIEQRLKTVLTNKEYNLPYWGISSYEKFLSKIFPNYFIRFNKKYRTVADYVNLDYKSDGEVWEQYASFQKEIAKPCFELYTNLNYNNSKEVSESTLINDFFEFIYETKIKDDEIDMDLEFIVNIHTQLKKISIQNYYCIKDIDLPKLTNEVYIVGENGVGKTLLLQAIFWAIQYPLIENDPENTLGTAWIKRNFNQLENLNIEIETNEVDDNFYKYPKPEYQEQNKRILNFFAYGVNRQYQKGNEDTYEFMSLFNSEVPTSLRNPENWLIKKYNAEFRKKTNGRLSYEKVVSFLEDLLDDKIKISIEEDRNDNLKVIFKEQNTESIEFNLLSDGYKSVFTLLTDLLSRLAENQPNAEKITDFKGVVLIDELDLFLHPKWSYNIVKQLKDKLPNIQFIITTHSPMLILGAGKDALFYRMYKENGISKILGPIENKNMSE